MASHKKLGWAFFSLVLVSLAYYVFNYASDLPGLPPTGPWSAKLITWGMNPDVVNRIFNYGLGTAIGAIVVVIIFIILDLKR